MQWRNVFCTVLGQFEWCIFPLPNFEKQRVKKAVSLQSPICSCEETRFIPNWFYIRRQIFCAPPFVRRISTPTFIVVVT
jgi:hypothetical protein